MQGKPPLAVKPKPDDSDTVFIILTNLNPQCLLFLSSFSCFFLSLLSDKLAIQSGLRQSLTRTLNEITTSQVHPC